MLTLSTTCGLRTDSRSKMVGRSAISARHFVPGTATIGSRANAKRLTVNQLTTKNGYAQQLKGCKAMVKTEFDKPPDKTIKCMLCSEPLVVRHHWIAVINQWMHPTCHDACVDKWKRENRGGEAAPWERAIPERFRSFNAMAAPDQRAVAAANDFGPDSQFKTLAIIGPRGSSKSRLMWNVIQGFFDILGNGRWVDYYIFPDLMTEFDRGQITKLKLSKYAFV